MSRISSISLISQGSLKNVLLISAETREHFTSQSARSMKSSDILWMYYIDLNYLLSP